MKTVACVSMMSACITASVLASPIVYRNGADGSFLWGAQPSMCWQRLQSFLDVSQPLNQTGTESNRTLGRSVGCIIGWYCEYAFSDIWPSGSDVQLAAGRTTTVYFQCSDPVTMEALWNFGYNEVVDSSRTWTSNRYHVAMQSRGGGGAFVGRFVGLRVRLNDGWHYGWLRLAEYSGTSASGTAYESYFPGAYALETEPDTSIRTPLCPLDVNMDGVISTEDYFAYLEYFAEGDYRARWSPYDPLDNQVDFFDYLDFLSAFLAGC